MLRCTEPGADVPAIAALIVLPSARPIRMAGMPTGGSISPDMRAGLFDVWTTTTATAPAASAFTVWV